MNRIPQPRRTVYHLGLCLAAMLAVVPALAQEARTNAFNDPFGAVTSAMPACPAPEGPLLTASEATQETHWRAERGTSCYRSGRCRLPNAYLYDKEIYPRAVQYLRGNGRFDDTSLWLIIQRRVIFVQGCVKTAEQGRDLEATLRLIDDVDGVVGQWMVGTDGKPPYPLLQPVSAK